MSDGSLPDNFVWAAQWLRCWLIKVQNTGEWRTDVPGGPDALTDTQALAEVLNVAGRGESGLWDVAQGLGELGEAGFDPEVVKRLFEATLSGTVTLYGSMPPAAFHASMSDLPAPTYYRRKNADNPQYSDYVDTDDDSDDGSSVLMLSGGAPPASAISPGHDDAAADPLVHPPPSPAYDPNSPSWSPNSPTYAPAGPSGDEPSNIHYSPPSP
jgi:hypothetical protein